MEEKVFKFKPHYTLLYSRVLRHCLRTYYVSAWFRAELERRFNIGSECQRLLPNFVRAEAIEPRRDFNPNTFLSILHLDVYKKKGLDRLLPAFRQALELMPEARLDLIGRGKPETFVRLSRLIAQLELSDHVRLVGPLAHTELLRRLPDYAAMVLPGRNETFGMAYVESLLSGVPVLYSKGTGIDGYLNDVEAAIAVDCRSIADICDGLVRLSKHQHMFRTWLLENHLAIRNRFVGENYIQQYNDDIRPFFEQRRLAMPLSPTHS